MASPQINTSYDLLVVGAGINGAAVAWEAALRGLRVMLIDKGDFGGGASSGCFRIAHGGIRYLQHFDFRRCFESIAEQRTLRRIAPQLVHPFPFLVPCYGWGKRGPLYLGLGVTVYDFLSCFRNTDLEEALHLPGPQILSAEEVLKHAPCLDPKGLTGGVIYWDCQISNCERMTWLVVKSAIAAGAECRNYTQAEKFLSPACSPEHEPGSRVVEIRSLETGHLEQVQARHVVLATGPWFGESLEQLAGKPVWSSSERLYRRTWSKGVQLVMGPIPSRTPSGKLEVGLALESHYKDPDAILGRGGRSYFLVPWRNSTLVGTADIPASGSADDYKISKGEIIDLLKEVNTLYPAKEQLAPANIRAVFGGLRPLDRYCFEHSLDQGTSQGKALASPTEVSRFDEWLDLSTSVPGLAERFPNTTAVLGVKYTTFRSMAERVVNHILKTSKTIRPSKSANTPLVDSNIEDSRKFEATIGSLWSTVPPEMLHRIVQDYGTATESIAQLANSSNELNNEVVAKSGILKAELCYSLRQEKVVKLTDLLLRRTSLSLESIPSADLIEEVSKLAMAELGWSEQKRMAEIEDAKVKWGELDSLS